MQFTCDRNALTGAIERVAHAINTGLTGNGNQSAEEITTAQDQTQTEELTEQTTQDSSGTIDTDSTKPETKHKPPLSEAAILARREYNRQYRARNKDKINARQRKWHKEHPEKQKQYNATHWNKVGAALAAVEEG